MAFAHHPSCSFSAISPAVSESRHNVVVVGIRPGDSEESDWRMVSVDDFSEYGSCEE